MAGPASVLNADRVADVRGDRLRPVPVDDRAQRGGDAADRRRPTLTALEPAVGGAAHRVVRRSGSWWMSSAAIPFVQAKPLLTGCSSSARTRSDLAVLDGGDEAARRLAHPAEGRDVDPPPFPHAPTLVAVPVMQRGPFRGAERASDLLLLGGGGRI